MESSICETSPRVKVSPSPWWFVPSLYWSEGIPYCVVMVLSVIVFKRMGISNAQIGFWTSILNLP